MSEAINDYRALMLLESLAGRAFTESLCDTFFGERVTETTMPADAANMLAFRQAVNAEIAARI